MQLAEVRSQATARAEELRTLLDGLLTGATEKCNQMDAQLDKFLQFLTGQQGQMADEALRNETAAIARQASQLEGVIQRCRKQIDDLAGVLARTRDVAQAASLIAVQAQSEKVLESLTLEAADRIKQVDDLLEKIPAGGVDVTRRTVLQQRLRSRFAEVQKTQHEMTETLSTLRPAVNFRLDAALTAVSGLARRLQDRQKVLAEQIQQQDAQSRRLDYDRRLQQAQGEFDELAIERDRLMTRLTQATQEMLDADPGRTRLIQIRARSMTSTARSRPPGRAWRPPDRGSRPSRPPPPSQPSSAWTSPRSCSRPPIAPRGWLWRPYPGSWSHCWFLGDRLAATGTTMQRKTGVARPAELADITLPALRTALETSPVHAAARAQRTCQPHSRCCGCPRP